MPSWIFYCLNDSAPYLFVRRDGNHREAPLEFWLWVKPGIRPEFGSNSVARRRTCSTIFLANCAGYVELYLPATTHLQLEGSTISDGVRGGGFGDV